MSLVRIDRGGLLRKAVGSLSYLSARGVIKCSANDGLVIQAKGSTHSLTVMFKAAPDQALITSPIDDDHHEGMEFVSVDLNALSDALNIVEDGDSIAIRFCFKLAKSRDSFLNFIACGNDGKIRLDHMNISYVPVDHHVGAAYNADLVVGMDSGVFWQILTSLDQYGKTVTVSITDSRVEFTAGDETVTMTKQRDGCIIGGARGENPTILVIHTYYMFSYNLASGSARSTWLLRLEDGSALIIVPVWPLGNIMYLFPRPPESPLQREELQKHPRSSIFRVLYR